MTRWRYGLLALVCISFATTATVAVYKLQAVAKQPVHPSFLWIWLGIWLGDFAMFVVSARLLYLAIRPRKLD